MKRVGAAVAAAVVSMEILIVVGVALRQLPVDGSFQRIGPILAGLGPLAPLIYAGVYALGVVAFFPGALLTMGAGLLFGAARGFAVASVGSVLGASAAFLIARHLLRSRVEEWARHHPRFAVVDEAVGVKGWKIVALTRLSPVFPFNALNYGYGVTRVRFGHYALASWLAMVPGTLLYTYLGSLGRVGAEALTGSNVETYRIVLNVLGLGATGVVTLLVTRLAQRGLARETPGRADE